jgi:hypothetical protein
VDIYGIYQQVGRKVNSLGIVEPLIFVHYQRSVFTIARRLLLAFSYLSFACYSLNSMLSIRTGII